MKNAGVYAKTIIAIFGAIVTALGPYLATYKWWPAVPAVLTALTVYLVPNAAPVVAPPPPAREPLPPGTYSTGAATVVSVTPKPEA